MFILFIHGLFLHAYFLFRFIILTMLVLFDMPVDSPGAPTFFLLALCHSQVHVCFDYMFCIYNLF